MSEDKLAALRAEVGRVNLELLTRLQERARLVLELGALKQAQGLDTHDPAREDEMLRELCSDLAGPLGAAEVRDLFAAILRSSRELLDRTRRQGMRARAPDLVPAGGVRVGAVAIGGGVPIVIAGPCSVESEEQLERVASFVRGFPAVRILRAGAFKPRTSPYTFQGLREEGLRILRRVADRHGLVSVTEVLDTSTLEVVAEYSDMLQVGARNMYNTELLKAIGRLRKPVLLKRGFMATLDELLLSAEYILGGGNDRVVLCERGIRTFEPRTRSTLDIAAVPLLKMDTRLPVVVDVSHALGRRDILLPCARAALAAGADGIMVEVHHAPGEALSDGFQQLDLEGFAALMRGLAI
ncbi:MAG: bifunctional 3-deoxy-7-phosphoheptulonate synthase/chorismate mutase [Vicinamibacteria bacterium]|nr:bifunctional 3-deoxy-7-phosphoheptulonate synthase/chorismate mutase [Vicinamibacteria bacterium]